MRHLAQWRRSLHSGAAVARNARRRPTYRDEFSEILIRGAREQLKKEAEQQGRAQPQPWDTRPRIQPQWPQQVRQAQPMPPISPVVLPSGITDHPRVTLVLVIIGGAGVYYVANLEQVPSTGRWRFNDVGIADEQQMGEQAYQQTLAQYRGRILPESHPATVQVRRVVARIIKAAAELDAERAPGAQPTQWSVHVVKDNQTNAFVLPGGKIFVFTGILPVCGSDAGLATVLSHEVSHQLARHSAEKMAGYKVLLLGTFVLDLLGFDFGLSRVALNLLLSLPNSRKLETEADYLGLQLMARACYDPDNAANFWKRMDRADGHKSDILSSVLSTHPVNAQRIESINEWLPKARQLYSASGCRNAHAFMTQMR